VKKHWSQTKWSDFTTKQKMWFWVLCICLAVILILSCLVPSGIVYVPDLAIVLIAAGAVVALCKFFQFTPWAALGFEDAFDEDDDAVDAEENTDI